MENDVWNQKRAQWRGAELEPYSGNASWSDYRTSCNQLVLSRLNRNLLFITGRPSAQVEKSGQRDTNHTLLEARLVAGSKLTSDMSQPAASYNEGVSFPERHTRNRRTVTPQKQVGTPSLKAAWILVGARCLRKTQLLFGLQGHTATLRNSSQGPSTELQIW